MGIDGVMARIQEIMDRISQLEGLGRRPAARAPSPGTASPRVTPGSPRRAADTAALKGPEFRRLLEQLLSAQTDLAQTGGTNATAGLLSGGGGGDLGSLLGLSGGEGGGGLDAQNLQGALSTLLGSGSSASGADTSALQDTQRLLRSLLQSRTGLAGQGSRGEHGGKGTAPSAAGSANGGGAARAAARSESVAQGPAAPASANAPAEARPPDGVEAPRAPDEPRLPQ